VPVGDFHIMRFHGMSVRSAGSNPTSFSGHSLRAGLVTTAAAAGVDERTIMEQIGHKTFTLVCRYMRRGSLFRNNAAAQLRL
jgi:hypothetical protein